MATISTLQSAQYLLAAWGRWARTYDFGLGYPRMSPEQQAGVGRGTFVMPVNADIEACDNCILTLNHVDRVIANLFWVRSGEGNYSHSKRVVVVAKKMKPIIDEILSIAPLSPEWASKAEEDRFEKKRKKYVRNQLSRIEKLVAQNVCAGDAEVPQFMVGSRM